MPTVCWTSGPFPRPARSPRVDLGVLVALSGFTAWGAWRGPLRPLIALALLAAAFAAAGALASPLMPTAARVTGLSDAASEAAAWGAAWFGALVLGSALLAIAQPFVRRTGAGGGLGRLVGAVLGLAQGGAWCAILAYVLIGRSTAPGSSDVPTSSHTWAAVARVGAGARAHLALPGWIAARMEEVERAFTKE